MTKHLTLFLLGLLVAACQSTSVSPISTAVEESVVSATETDLPAATATIQATASNEPVESTALPTSTDLPAIPEENLTVMAGCTLQTALNWPDESEPTLFPPVTDDDWRLGPETAAVTIIEYGDFQ